MSKYPKRTSLSGAKNAAENRSALRCASLRIKSGNLGNTVCLYDREGKICTALPLEETRSPLRRISRIFSTSHIEACEGKTLLTEYPFECAERGRISLCWTYNEGRHTELLTYDATYDAEPPLDSEQFVSP